MGVGIMLGQVFPLDLSFPWVYWEESAGTEHSERAGK